MTDTTTRRDLTASDVAAYLRHNPQFLVDYPELALMLTLPKQQGETTSLASYQLEVLRDKNRALNRRLHELVAIASENEQLVARVHALTLSLMRATDLDETLRRVVATLNEDLATDLVRVVLFHAPAAVEPADWLSCLPRDHASLQPFLEFFGRGEPLCGRLPPEKLSLLFGSRAADVRSAVLLPVPSRGMIAVGSTDPNRFHPGMGTMFLKLIADAVGAAMARFDAG
ncbi:MAG TPA: DUF484 family protein [Xanthomonadales bacterium]|nr:DUF484 family protein [Xanthomonadales bacterium]